MTKEVREIFKGCMLDGHWTDEEMVELIELCEERKNKGNKK